MKELLHFAIAIPQSKEDFLDIIEMLLKKYLEECKQLIIDLTTNKHCGLFSAVDDSDEERHSLLCLITKGSEGGG